MSQWEHDAVYACNNFHVDFNNLVGFTLTLWESDGGMHHFGGCQDDEFLVWFKLKVSLSLKVLISLENIQCYD